MPANQRIRLYTIQRYEYNEPVLWIPGPSPVDSGRGDDVTLSTETQKVLQEQGYKILF